MSQPCGSKIGGGSVIGQVGTEDGAARRRRHTGEKNPTVAGLAGSEISFQKRVLDEDIIPVVSQC